MTWRKTNRTHSLVCLHRFVFFSLKFIEWLRSVYVCEWQKVPKQTYQQQQQRNQQRQTKNNNIVTKKHNIKKRMINFVAHKICLLGKNSGSNYVKAHWTRGGTFNRSKRRPKKQQMALKSKNWLDWQKKNTWLMTMQNICFRIDLNGIWR